MRAAQSQIPCLVFLQLERKKTSDLVVQSTAVIPVVVTIDCLLIRPDEVAQRAWAWVESWRVTIITGSRDIKAAFGVYVFTLTSRGDLNINPASGIMSTQQAPAIDFSIASHFTNFQLVELPEELLTIIANHKDETPV